MTIRDGLNAWKGRPNNTRFVEAIIDLAHYIPPSPGFEQTTLNAAGAPIRYPPGSRHIRGRVASPHITPLGDGHAHVLIVTDLTERDLARAFPLGYIIDPDF